MNRPGDRFGGALSVRDVDGDGGVWVFPATSDGPSPNRSWSFNGSTLHAPNPDARFGQTLAPHGR
ncbi:hypothetical protein AB0N16_37480 [Streptomyces sp. NPDC051105]|uniref:hypothetical protein n=1 Tax=Streptomyces sp. NPDC051105 TaxID=3154843 RepID=UPI00342ED030